jgi:hypothetical protein
LEIIKMNLRRRSATTSRIFKKLIGEDSEFLEKKSSSTETLYEDIIHNAPLKILKEIIIPEGPGSISGEVLLSNGEPLSKYIASDDKLHRSIAGDGFKTVAEDQRVEFSVLTRR